MNKEEYIKLRSYYQSLLEQQLFFDSLGTGKNIRFASIKPLILELNNLKHDFPEIVPYNTDNQHFTDDDQIDYIAARGFLASTLGKLKVTLEQHNENNPVVEKRQFSFITDKKIRTIVERDYEEIQRGFIASCWKSVLVLCGGAIEAILTDLLLANQAIGIAAKSAPKENDITKWDFSKLIDVAVELELVSPGIQKLSHPLREYRNLIHPSNEIRNKLLFDAEEARIAIEVLHILHRDLSH
jgi:hypothetical protein